MKYFLFALLLLPATPASTVQPAAFGNEQLTYNVNWPSGLSLGEGQLLATRTKTSDGDRWELELNLDAAIPGVRVRDRFRSITGTDFRSVEFDKDLVHGSRIAKEKVTFDSQSNVTRTTAGGGGKTEMSLAPSTRDALAYLYHVRKELSQGRVPPPQTVVFGAPYQVRLEYTGAQNVRVNDKSMQADGVVVFAKGPASTFSFELFFARDAVRTPVMARVPLSMGTFSMELAR